MDFIRRTDSSLKLQEKLAREKQKLLENVKREVGNTGSIRSQSLGLAPEIYECELVNSS